MKRFSVPAGLLKKVLVLLSMSMLILSSCSKGITAPDDGRRISFLEKYEVTVDSGRPYYSSEITIPKIFNSIWEIRRAFTRDILQFDLLQFKGKQCSIFMYPVSKLPPGIKKNSPAEPRAVVINYRDKIICAYIEFISETGGTPPVSLNGKTIMDITGVKWDKWRADMESDDNKRLVIWQYYNSLRSKDYEEAYSYIYDKSSIGKNEFIKAAGGQPLPDMDLSDLEQCSQPLSDRCSFIAKTNIEKSGKSKIYEITFELKKDPSSNEFGGWKVASTSIK